MPPTHPSPLNERQERFVHEYLIDQNARAAAARAGYNARNMAAQGSDLLNHPLIRERIRRGIEAVLAELRASALALMKQRMRAAFFDAGRLFRAGWELLPLAELDEETRSTLEVKTVQRKSGPVVIVKQPDRHRALRALEKVFEKLEGLNDRHYAWAEKHGLVKSLGEIEAMDGAEVDAGISEKDQVLSGGRLEEAAWLAKKNQVLSGGWGRAVPDPCEKDQVLAGSGAQGLAENAREGLVLSDWAGALGEKHSVLSGGWRAPVAWFGAFAQKYWGLSGLKYGQGSRLRVNNKCEIGGCAPAVG